jgi:hypothetical protein
MYGEGRPSRQCHQAKSTEERWSGPLKDIGLINRPNKPARQEDIADDPYPEHRMTGLALKKA